MRAARRDTAGNRDNSAGRIIGPARGFGVFLLASVTFLAIGLSCAALFAMALSGGCVYGTEQFRSIYMDRVFPRVLGAGMICPGICMIRMSAQPGNRKTDMRGRSARGKDQLG